MKKICILTFEGNPIAIDLFLSLCSKYDVYMSYTDNINSPIKQIWRKKRGIRWYLYNTLFKWASTLFSVSHHPALAWKDLLCKHPDAIIKTSDHNSIEHQKLLKQLKIDLGVLIGTTLIHPEVFNIPLYGMLNLHQGNIPDYRGAPPGFWEHHFNEKNMYVSVHTVVERFDAGCVLGEVNFQIKNHEHFVVSKVFANSYSAKLLANSIDQAFQGWQGEKRSIQKGTNTVPGYWLLLQEYLKLLKKQIKSFHKMKQRDEKFK